MTLVFYEAESRFNKGFTTEILVERIKQIFELASGFDDAVDAFNELSDELSGTDFCVFFGSGEDFNCKFPPENWYVSIDNFFEKTAQIFDVTEEVRHLN